jgi:N-acetylated-alpha-linked acidic dipeptidase
MTDGDRLAAVVDAVSAERLMDHVAEFSRWTKHAGTSEELFSLDHVETTLRADGYLVRRLFHRAYISLPGSATLRLGARDVPTIVHSFSQPTGPEGLRARVVEADAPDVRGAAVLIDGVAHPRTLLETTDRGAVAQIYISPDNHRHEMCMSSVWGSPDDQTLAKLPRTVVLSVAHHDGQLLRAGASRGGSVEITATVDTGWRWTPVVVADLGRVDGAPDEPFVLFTGHHDTWYVGAMDNGGGNATMLEVARICAAHRSEWKRALRVIFWSGHSQGRYSSSAWYADHHWEELEQRAVAHVNVDSTGGVGHVLVSNAPASRELAAIAEEALSTQGGQSFGGRPMGRAGDQSFWGIGVPSIFANMGEQEDGGRANEGQPKVGPGTGWWWHTPDDTANRIDPDLLHRDTRIYLHGVWRLVSSEILPLDYSAVAMMIATRLSELQAEVGNRIDLSTADLRAQRFLELTRRFQADPPCADNANRILQHLSRLLVPLVHTNSDRFSHDPALPLSPLSALEDVERLAHLDIADPEFHFLSTRLVRCVNRVSVTLRDAIAVLES